LRPVDRNELLARARTQVRRKRFQERLRDTYEDSLSMALKDSLTGLYNRRYFDAHITKMLANHKESKKNLGILFLDIDHFKKVNDVHGHNVGDEVLKIFAQRLKDNLRSFDLVVRLGGEEFVVILPDTSENMAQFIAERLRIAICDDPIKCSVEDGALTISTSIGGAIVKPGEHNVQQILDRADQALFDAKNGGRNCVVFENIGNITHQGKLPKDETKNKDKKDTEKTTPE
jgi:two-component system cell cycle response regulator